MGKEKRSMVENVMTTVSKYLFLLLIILACSAGIIWLVKSILNLIGIVA